MAKVLNPFRCRDCDQVTRVLRTDGDGDVTRRTRECPDGHKFVTREVYERDVREFAHRGKRGKAVS